MFLGGGASESNSDPILDGLNERILSCDALIRSLPTLAFEEHEKQVGNSLSTKLLSTSQRERVIEETTLFCPTRTCVGRVGAVDDAQFGY